MKFLINKLNLKGKELRPICGFPRYAISEYGEVVDLLKERVVSQIKGNTGYLCVNLYDTENKKNFKSVHRLVAIAYMPNPRQYKEVNHVSGNKHNNHYVNLQWCSRTDNTLHAIFNKLRTPRLVPYFLISPETREIVRFPSKKEASLAIKQEPKFKGWKIFPTTLLPKLGVSLPVLAFDSDDYFISTYQNSKAAADELNLSHRSVTEICRGTYHSAKGYTFKYLHALPTEDLEILLIHDLIDEQTLSLYTNINGTIDMFAIGSNNQELENRYSDEVIELMLTHPFCTK